MKRSSSTPDLTPSSSDQALEATGSQNAKQDGTQDGSRAKELEKTPSKIQEQEKPAAIKDLAGKMRTDSTSSNEADTVDELHSVSAMQPARRRLQRKISLPETRRAALLKRLTVQDIPAPAFTQHGGYNPAFLFLQLYHSNMFDAGDGRPVALPSSSPDVIRSIKMLDFLHPSETHAIGVIYVGPGQASKETAILANVYGSTRYVNFLQGLGELICLKDCKPGEIYVGGLDNAHDNDGQFAYSWRDDFMQGK